MNEDGQIWYLIYWVLLFDMLPWGWHLIVLISQHFGSLLCQTLGVLLPLLIKFKELLTWWRIICKVITMCHKSSSHKSKQSVDCLPQIWFINVGGWSLNAELRVKALRVRCWLRALFNLISDFYLSCFIDSESWWV